VSVLYADDLHQSWIDEPPPWTCTECADEVTPPLVYWRAGYLDLFYHRRCAAKFGAHLIADAREATLAADPEPRWRRRLIAGVRHRLEREEQWRERAVDEGSDDSLPGLWPYARALGRRPHRQYAPGAIVDRNA
jgi:hypothetical protein